MNCFLCQVNVNQGTNKVKRRKLSESTTQNVRDILEKFSWDSYGCIIPILEIYHSLLAKTSCPDKNASTASDVFL